MAKPSGPPLAECMTGERDPVAGLRSSFGRGRGRPRVKVSSGNLICRLRSSFDFRSFAPPVVVRGGASLQPRGTEIGRKKEGKEGGAINDEVKQPARALLRAEKTVAATAVE